MPTRADLIKQARSWIDVPALASGAQRVGCNCLGLHVGYLRELGGFDALVEEAEKYVGFKHPETPSAVLQKLFQTNYFQMVRPMKLHPGNFVLLFTREGPQHLALVTEPGVILHASQVKKKVVEHLIFPKWRPAAEFLLRGLSD